MGIRFSYSVCVQSRETATTPCRRGVALFGCLVLFVGTVGMLCWNIGFARYAITGMFWQRTSGTVVDARTTSTPTILFEGRDGAGHRFTEDYILLCGGSRSFCFIRDFDPGETVPVVYDPGAPRAAFVDDWALSAGVISWFGEAAAALFFAGMMALLVGRKPLDISVEG
jgi:hypothetical protein